MALSYFSGGRDGVRDKLNQLVDAVNALQKIRGDEIFISVRHGSNGTTVGLNIDQVLPRIPKTHPGDSFIVGVLVSVDYDHIVMRLWDGSVDGNNNPTNVGDADIPVAKPWHLRKTPWDSQTIGGYSYSYPSEQQRSVTKDSVTVDQQVYPAYLLAEADHYPGDMIVAASHPNTGVFVDNVELKLMELPGRVWVRMCEET